VSIRKQGRDELCCCHDCTEELVYEEKERVQRQKHDDGCQGRRDRSLQRSARQIRQIWYSARTVLKSWTFKATSDEMEGKVEGWSGSSVAAFIMNYSNCLSIS
jgi:hypothetical protein